MTSFKWAEGTIFLILIGASSGKYQTPTVEIVEGETGLLECPMDYKEIVAWITNDRNDNVVALNVPNDNLQVASNGSLVINTVRANMSGEYRCLAETHTGVRRAAVVYLSVSSNVEQTQWEKYETKVLQGVVVGSVLLLVFTFGCLVNSYKWRPYPSEDERPLSEVVSATATRVPNDPDLPPYSLPANGQSMEEVSELSDSVFEPHDTPETRF